MGFLFTIVLGIQFTISRIEIEAEKSRKRAKEQHLFDKNK